MAEAQTDPVSQCGCRGADAEDDCVDDVGVALGDECGVDGYIIEAVEVWGIGGVRGNVAEEGGGGVAGALDLDGGVCVGGGGGEVGGVGL